MRKVGFWLLKRKAKEELNPESKNENVSLQNNSSEDKNDELDRDEQKAVEKVEEIKKQQTDNITSSNEKATPLTDVLKSISGQGKTIPKQEETTTRTKSSGFVIKDGKVQIPDVIINGDRRYRLPCNASVSFRNIDAKTLITELSNRKICVSGGSACSSKNPKPSHVLRAIGLQPNIANNTIRVTFGLDNDMEDVVYTVNQIKDIINN